MRIVLGAVGVTLVWVGGVVALVHRTPSNGLILVAMWLVLVPLTWWVVRSPQRVRRPVLAMAVVAALAQLPGLFQPPLTSSDSYRYVWDGRVQLAGISPYRYAPLDDRLAFLRDPVLFPGLGADQRSGYVTQPVPTDRAALLALAENDSRVAINRPKVPTIYPPVAQLWFVLIAAATPWSVGTLGLQIGSAALAAVVAAILAALLRRRRRNPLHALWWSWSPAVMLEVGNGAHVDVVAAVLILAAVVVGDPLTYGAPSSDGDLPRGKRVLAGVLVGMAASVKLFPLLTVAAFAPLARRKWARVVPAPVAAVVTLALSYLPHVLVAGSLVVGYLRGYTLEEGSGSLAVLKLVMPDVLAAPVAVVVIAAVAIWGARRLATGIHPAVPACVLLGSFLLLATPAYPWYAVPLAALAVAADRLEWMLVAVAAELGSPSSGAGWSSVVLYLVAGLLILVVVLRRRGLLGNAPRSSPAR